MKSMVYGCVSLHVLVLFVDDAINHPDYEKESSSVQKENVSLISSKP